MELDGIDFEAGVIRTIAANKRLLTTNAAGATLTFAVLKFNLTI